ncbi:Fe-S protein, radical SAM family [Candidatus Koribacter versatilis Ellin345]|uniref:Fe-S protein, radical SAM family n=1 Tax=Koribacter versatilis (strain Ellin345) TaxID=204669 RepID=Q1IP63_KORVE|nr:radical SAM protein [Candidatus Koribacter versatilis]ABF41337.1 Fe-S protein, radical SAM family [Candidatus Koribacter versatilis Ellin345]
MPDSAGILPLPLFSSSLKRDTSRPVMLIGFQHQGNLGLGYLASTLREHGYSVLTCDFEAETSEIIESARQSKPMIVGFSLIFQFYIRKFDALMQALRAAGVDCHFTIGGHFPSLSHEETLRMLPELDSVVRFEGEMTLLELADVIGTGRDWHDLQGIAYRGTTGVVTNPMRSLVDDLDSLPYPERNFEPEKALGRKALPLLASRGCARTCSFCSIQTFYRTAPGKIVRTRKPAKVIEEMQAMHEERGISIFLFQDDDFPLFGPVWRRWAYDFVDCMHRSGLAQRVIWKINCRADAVEPEIFTAMRDAGLYLVYMGLESGNEEGLKTLHKQVSVEQNIRAVEMLKQVGLLFEFGFMMFDPGSTLESIKQNLRFLRTILNDGCAAAVFCRMLPYDGTPIKDELERAGRLLGDVCAPSYDFLDPRVSKMYNSLSQIVDVWGWIHGYRALSPQLNWAWNEVAIMERLYPGIDGLEEYRRRLAAVTKKSNDVLFSVMDNLLEVAEFDAAERWDNARLDALRREFLEELLRERDAFVEHNQSTMLRVLRAQPVQEAASA